MSRKAYLLLLLSALLSAACATVSPAKRVPYTCADAQTITATYVRYGRRGTEFVVLDWKGQEYGLARALSASGARYASRFGPAMSGHGLEWWEAKGEARLSAFTGKGPTATRPLLTDCHPQS